MINETITSINTIADATWNYLSIDLFNRGIDIVEAPIYTPNMLWMLLPLIATLILMEVYFGRYKDEELGWSTAYGNTLVLIFISIDLFRRLFEPSGQSLLQFIITASNIKIIIPLTIAVLALVLMIVDFFHFLPKKVAYIICSPTYINLLGLLGISIVYTSTIPLDGTTIFACAILFILINLLALLVHYIIPSYKPTISKILTTEDIEKYGEELKTKKKKEFVVKS